MEGDVLETLQRVAGPELGETVALPEEIRRAVGPVLDSWILAAQAERDSFVTGGAVQMATPEDIIMCHKRPFPMLNARSRTDHFFASAVHAWPEISSDWVQRRSVGRPGPSQPASF